MISGWKEEFIVARKRKVTKPSTFVNASEAEEVLVWSIPLLFSCWAILESKMSVFQRILFWGYLKTMKTKRVHVHEVYGKPMDIKEAEFEDTKTPPHFLGKNQWPGNGSEKHLLLFQQSPQQHVSKELPSRHQTICKKEGTVCKYKTLGEINIWTWIEMVPCESMISEWFLLL